MSLLGGQQPSAKLFREKLTRLGLASSLFTMVATNNGDSVTDPVISGSAADQRRLLWGPFSDMRCALDLDPKFVGAFDLHPVCSIPGNLGLVPGWLPITSRRPAEWSRCPFFPHLISHQVHQSSSKRRKKEKGLHLGSLADVARPRPSPRLLSESPPRPSWCRPAPLGFPLVPRSEQLSFLTHRDHSPCLATHPLWSPPSLV